MNHRRYSSIVLIGLALGVVSQCAAGSDFAAFGLIKKGDAYVGDSAKDKVVEIRSDKSTGSLIPNVWYVVYAATATLTTTEVKFGGGRMIDVKGRLRLLEPMKGGNKTLDGRRFKVDCNRALAIALKEPLFAGLHLKATQFWLQQGDRSPVWKIRFWAAKLGDRDKMAEMGEVFVSSNTGNVVQNNLHPKSAD